MRTALGERVMHLAQVHTMNSFQHGGGKTPSRQEIDRIVQLDEQLSVSGIGFYTKNALPTEDFSNDPMSPNSVGQSMAYESSRDRWDYGLLKLFETSGVHFAALFDLVIDARGAPPAAISAWNRKTGAWDLVGVTGDSAESEGGTLSVFRALSADLYLTDGRQLSLHSSGAGGGSVWAIPSEPAERFRSSQSLARELGQDGTIPGSRAQAALTPATTLCVR